ncbi:MAG: hypothetical protein Q9218_000200 [Villophora microphyllina]
MLTPGLATYLASMKDSPVESSLDRLRRQIRDSQPCAVATAHLLRRVVGASRVIEVASLVERIQKTGDKLVTAQPKELAVDNIVRRVLRVIRDEAEENRDGQVAALGDVGSETAGDKASMSPSVVVASPTSEAPKERPPMSMSHAPTAGDTTTAGVNSLFGLLSQPSSKSASPLETPNHKSPTMPPSASDGGQDLRAEVIEGIEEIIDELNQVDDQIAGYASDHIYSNEVVLTYSPSATIRKFLLKAASKRRFTVVCVENSSRNVQDIHPAATRNASSQDDKVTVDIMQRSLTAVGITVLMVPHSAVYALMSRVSKVLLDSHLVLADGGLLAAAGGKVVVRTANMHRTPVIVLSGVYKLSPILVSDPDSLIEYGNPGGVISSDQSNVMEKIATENPLHDYIPANSVDLYITNLYVLIHPRLVRVATNQVCSGGHSPSYIYRIVADHYRPEDMHHTSLAK